MNLKDVVMSPERRWFSRTSWHGSDKQYIYAAMCGRLRTRNDVEVTLKVSDIVANDYHFLTIDTSEGKTNAGKLRLKQFQQGDILAGAENGKIDIIWIIWVGEHIFVCKWLAIDGTWQEESGNTTLSHRHWFKIGSEDTHHDYVNNPGSMRGVLQDCLQQVLKRDLKESSDAAKNNVS